MAKKKAKINSHKKAPANDGSAVIYIVLGILVIATSFYAGYLYGQTSDGTAPTVKETDSVGETKLTVIEYSDFECPFCARAAPTMTQLKAAYPDVTFEYKHFPLESIHPDALNAAVATECIRNEGGDEAFWEFHDAIFAGSGLDAASLKSKASDIGYDIGSCLDNQETLSKVRADQTEARSRGVSGTPSFWIGDELVVGALPFETISAKIDEKLSGEVAPAPTPAPTPAPAPSPAPAPAEKADVDDGDYFLGDADAPVTVVEFSDFECPFCGRAHSQTYPQLKEDYIDTGKIKYSFRHFPLSFHQNAQKAGEAAECVGKLGGNEAFFEYADTLFGNQGALSVSDLKGYAGDQGLDQGAFDECLDSDEFASKIQSDFAAGQQAGVSGTPSFFINGNKLVGAQPFSSFQAAIDAELN
ncbi:thioredoxin domain-containing protein [Candidatus Woesearchaeota archaeon]|nr:thioredoxin domain-containing protein [Candidatus Woesearchaeota archaeon]